VYVYDNILLNFPLEFENFQAKVIDKSKHTFSVQTLFTPANRALYKIMSKNMVEPDRVHDNTIRRMRFACWITKA
jgi:hypothetical protein